MKEERERKGERETKRTKKKGREIEVSRKEEKEN